MDVTFHRLDGNRYYTTAVRDDGVTVRIPGYDRTSAVPHDLAHFVAEREFGMTRGFWGSVAAGALFTNLPVSGRQKPHAAERSKQIIKAHAVDIWRAETVAAAIHDAVEDDLAPEVVLRRLRAQSDSAGTGLPPMTVTDVRTAAAALRREAERWSAVPVGQSLTLTWPFRAEDIPMSRSGKARNGRLPGKQARYRH
jgi:hypothetical protein